MIRNDAQLELVREQLGRLERALKDLEGQVRPRSQTQFRIMSEGYIDHITRLRQEIGAYEGGRDRGCGEEAQAPTARRRPA